MAELLDVVRVEPLNGYRLLLDFENGERRLFDARPYLDRGVLRALRDPQLFAQA